jgi:hypothetical protein
VHSVTRIQGRSELDLTVDPPPDLVIEIDMTSPSLPKFPIFAQSGVPEVWRADGSLAPGRMRTSDVYAWRAGSEKMGFMVTPLVGPSLQAPSEARTTNKSACDPAAYSALGSRSGSEAMRMNVQPS